MNSYQSLLGLLTHRFKLVDSTDPTLMSWRSVRADGWERVITIQNPSLHNRRLRLVPLSVVPGTEQFERSSP